MDQPTTSTAKDKEKEVKITAENIGPETTKLLETIIWKAQLDQKSTIKSIPLCEPVARTARYTSMNIVNIEKLLAFGNILKFDNTEIDRQVIHKTLMSTYLIKNHIPTVTQLFSYIGDKLPVYVDLKYFSKILVKMGYVFYKFPGRKALRVMEKKSIMFERYRYLKSIVQYRKDKVPIVYFGFASITKRFDVLNLNRTFETDTNDILYHIFFTTTGESIENIKVIPTSTYEQLKKAIKHWLSELFDLQNVPLGRVCVFEDSKIFRETLIDVPTWKSTKSDIVLWLEEHNIPYHVEMSKTDLLQLTENYTDLNKNTYVIDNLFKTLDYTLLRLPECINGLSVSCQVIRYFNDNQYFEDECCRMNPAASLEKFSFSHLKKWLSIITSEEKNQLEDDIKLDNVIDDLVRKMKIANPDVIDNEDDTIVPIFSDSD